MVDISRKKYERNGIEARVYNDGIFWLNEKRIEEGLDHKKIAKSCNKNHSNYRKHRHGLVEEPKKQVNGISINQKFAIKVITDCRTTSAQT